MAGSAIRTRIQLKCDTEANWNKSVLVADGGEKESGTSFVPLKGEVIIYSADDTHPFFRLKVGNGVTNVVNLPFIESGSTNNFVMKENFINFPAIGEQNVLYLETSSNTIYDWSPSNGYAIKYEMKSQSVNTVLNWDAGEMTNLSIDENDPILLIRNGVLPTLQLDATTVVTGYGN